MNNNKTVAELLKEYPGGFAVGPGGEISKVVFASSHFISIAKNYPVTPPNGGYMVVETVDEEKEE